MNKFTPGPWELQGIHDRRRMILGPNKGRYVCDITIVQSGGGGIAQSMEAERESNAHLIAAAPDLLEALELFVKDHTLHDMNPKWHVFQKAKAAIAKARGEQQ